MNVNTYLTDGANGAKPSVYRDRDASGTLISPPEQAGSYSGSIANNTYSVTALSGAHATGIQGLGAKSGSGPTTNTNNWTAYDQTTTYALTSANVGKGLCQTINASPQNSSLTPQGFGSPLVGYNIIRSSSDIATSTACANIVSQWAVEPSSTINDRNNQPTTDTVSFKPSDTITFNHTLKGNSHVLKNADGGVVTVTGQPNQTGYPAPTGGIPSFTANTNNGDPDNLTTTKSNTLDLQEGSDSAMIGQDICQSLTVDKSAWSPDNPYTPATSKPVCAHIPYNYTVTPALTNHLSASQEAGSTISLGKSLTVKAVNGTNPLTTDPYITKTEDNLTTYITCTKNGTATCEGWTYANNNGTRYTKTAAISADGLAYYQSSGNGQSGPIPMSDGTSISINWIIPETATIGTEYCFQTVVANLAIVISDVDKTPAGGVNSNMSIDNNGAISSSSTNCFHVTKSPTLQIWGADSWSGEYCPAKISLDPSTGNNQGGFTAKDVPLASNGQFALSATWSQYGLFSRGDIGDSFGSAGHIANGQSSGGTQAAANALKFADGLNGNPEGYFFKTTNPNTPEAPNCLTDIFAYYSQRYTKAPDSTQLTSGNLSATLKSNGSQLGSSTRYVWLSADGQSQTIDGNSLTALMTSNANRDQVILVQGDLTISGDIYIYDRPDGSGNLVPVASYSDIGQLPNLIIAATGSIYIDPGVTHLDGIYYAGASFIDCDYASQNSDPQAAFSNNGTCKYPLQVTGAIVAGSTSFQRTYRTDTSSNDNIYNPTPAEIFYYPPTIWLEEYAHGKSLDSSLTTNFYREVAPRV
jgi:hypothetical protein